MASDVGAVVLGAINMDLVAVASRLPKSGETVHGTGFFTSPGGKGANQAVACARLGVRTLMVGRVGEDAFGPQLLESLQSYGVDTSQVEVDAEEPSGIAQIAVDGAGQNRILIVAGANGRCGQGEVERTAEALRQQGSALHPRAASLALHSGEASASPRRGVIFDTLLLQLELPLEVSLAAARVAKGMGRRVILDPAPAMPLSEEAYSLCDVIIPNEGEASALVGFDVNDAESAGRAARELLGRGLEGVVVKLGAQGCFYSTAEGEGEGHLPAFATSVVDTVAAGDAFNGAFAVALAEGRSVAEAARWGNAAGAISVSRRGAQLSMPSRQEVLALLERGVSP